MESLFKFIMVRPPEAVDPATQSIPLVASPKLLTSYNRALMGNSSSAALLAQISDQWLSSDQAIADSNGDPLAKGGANLAAAVTTGTTVAQARTAAVVAFGMTPEKVVGDPGFAGLLQRVSSTLVALKYLGRTDVRTEDLSAAFRGLSYVQLLAANADATVIPDPVEYFARTLTISGINRPVRGAPVPVAGPPEGGNANVGRGRQGGTPPDQAAALSNRARALVSAIGDLTSLPASALAVQSPGAPGPAAGALPTPKASTSSTTAATRATSAKLTPILDRTLPTTIGLVASNSALRLLAPSATLQSLSKDTTTTLSTEGVQLQKLTVPDAVAQLSRNLKSVSAQLAVLPSAQSPEILAMRVGGSIYEISPFMLDPNVFGQVPYTPIPTSHGDLTPVGIGDLLVVNQALKRYDAYDLSDVVNVMKGEHRSNETKRTQSETTTTTLETTTTTEQERDQQTTERFEMQTQTDNVQKSDESLKLGASVSASYGPFVTFKATADYGLTNSKEQSSKVATNYSKDVTNKASSKITQTIKQLQSTTYVQTYLEDNVHEWNNVGGTEHIIGQYQWLDKIYEAQVYNYGKRLLFDTTFPEPAAFLYYSMVGQPAPGSTLVKPSPFTLAPDDLNEWNYGYYVQQYDAAGVQAPPDPYTTVAKSFDGADDRTDRGELTKTAELPIPDGYKAVGANVCVSYTFWDQNAVAVVVALGSAGHVWNHSTGIGFWNTTLNDEMNSIPFTLMTFRVAIVTCSVEIQCSRTDRALEAWKLATHDAIKQGYEKQLRDYEDALAAAKNDAAAQAHGSNPLANAQATRDEMKRLMITLFTNQQFDIFGAIATGPYGYPQMDIPVAEAQGAYIRFFEEAFEWEQMMYIFYPYYWARKSLWSTRVLFTDDDPQFLAFLKAGAARVVVSVRPGFELAVAHFMETGQIWQGGDPPTITDPTYLSIVDEIKAQENAPQGQVAQGDPWDVRVPTTLVKLRLSDPLPEWAKDASGDWVSSN